MSIKVIMPSLGESVVEGTISKWLKKVGEPIEEFEPLLEVNTDKVDSEIPSPGSGVLLEILVPEGETVTAGTVLAMIGEPEEQALVTGTGGSDVIKTVARGVQPSLTTSTAVVSTETIKSDSRRDNSLGFISPVVARIASEHGVDLAQVPGTGLGGRITKKDVLAYLERQGADRDQTRSAIQTPVPASTDVKATEIAETIKPEVLPSPKEALPGDLLPLTNVRRAIAEHMVTSKRISPHVTTVMEADLSKVISHRQSNKESFQRDGVNLTYTPYFISAAVTALKAFPIVNSSWSEAGIIIHRSINIGMATSLGEGGLIVPVIKNADSLSLLGLARMVNDLANRARNRQLKPDEVREGTFTITNHGISGSLFATPIINQPQCAILGVGAIQKRVVVIDDAIAIRPLVYLSLTFDHRILDGAVADHFLAKVVESLQNWPGE